MNRIAAILESVETELLGRRGLSFSIASKQSGWTTEDAKGVCWRCAQSVGRHETDGDGCATCRANKLPWDRSMRLGHYDGIIRDAVLDLKFRRWRVTGGQLGEAFGTEIKGRIDAMGIKPCEAMIVPVPMTNRRRIRRGVDHTLVLARGVSRSSNVGISRLLSVRNRAEQIGLSATDRTKNMRGAFYVPNSARKRFKKEMGKTIQAIIVLDDVRTTGATLEECCRVLKREFGEILGVNTSEIWAASVAMAGDERKGGSEIEVRNELSSKGGELSKKLTLEV